MGQGSLLLWGHRYSLPQLGCSLQSVCCSSVPPLQGTTKHPIPYMIYILKRGEQQCQCTWWFCQQKWGHWLGYSHIFLLQCHVEPHKAEEWEWAQKNRRRKQYLLLSCSLATVFIIPCIWFSLAVPLPNAFCFVILWNKEFLLKASVKCTDPMLELERQAAALWKACLEIQLASAWMPCL